MWPAGNCSATLLVHCVSYKRTRCACQPSAWPCLMPAVALALGSALLALLPAGLPSAAEGHQSGCREDPAQREPWGGPAQAAQRGGDAQGLQPPQHRQGGGTMRWPSSFNTPCVHCSKVLDSVGGLRDREMPCCEWQRSFPLNLKLPRMLPNSSFSCQHVHGSSLTHSRGAGTWGAHGVGGIVGMLGSKA